MTSSDARKHLLYALRQVLRPIVRILIRAGIRFDELSELARGVYIESAIRDGVDRGGTPTRERIALATGVTRQQVDHYVENEGELPVAEPTQTASARENSHGSVAQVAYRFAVPWTLRHPAGNRIRRSQRLQLPQLGFKC